MGFCCWLGIMHQPRLTTCSCNLGGKRGKGEGDVLFALLEDGAVFFLPYLSLPAFAYAITHLLHLQKIIKVPRAEYTSLFINNRQGGLYNGTTAD